MLGLVLIILRRHPFSVLLIIALCLPWYRVPILGLRARTVRHRVAPLFNNNIYEFVIFYFHRIVGQPQNNGHKYYFMKPAGPIHLKRNLNNDLLFKNLNRFYYKIIYCIFCLQTILWKYNIATM